MTIALGRFERPRLPLVERIGRLHVVVVVDEQRPFPTADLADDRGRSAVDAQTLGLETRASRALENSARRLVDRALLRRYGRQAHQTLQLFDVFALAGAHVGIEGVEGGHTARLARRDRRRCASLALSEIAAWRVRRDLDPPLLAEVADEPVRVLDRLLPVHLRARWRHYREVQRQAVGDQTMAGDESGEARFQADVDRQGV